MLQIPNNKKIEQKTAEVQDIIEKMPKKAPRLVSIIVSTLAFTLMFFGWLIKYPESVSGDVTIRAIQAPVRLTAPSTGRLHILSNTDSLVKVNETFAFIESGTEISDFFFLDSILKKLPKEIGLSEIKGKILILGELSVAYMRLKNCIESIAQYEKNNPFEAQLTQLHVQKSGITKQLDYLKQQIATQITTNKLKYQNLNKDSIQFYQLHAINETKFLESKLMYLSSVQNLTSIKREIESSKNYLIETDTKISQLNIDKTEHVFNLEQNLYSSYYELKNQIKIWKQNYAFIAPFDGKLEMLGFWKENTFLKAGEEAFAILTNKNPVTAQVFVPAQGAGKIFTGQEVIIRLDDFPYLEFGSITGTVKNISMLTNESTDIIPQQKINCYQVNVELPEQLKTNYGTILNFKHDIKGVAQILVKKRKLIERLFDNLKYIINE